jgi:hypothetical protein
VLKRGCQAHFNRDDEARRSWPRRGTDANTAKRAGMVAEHGNNGRARGYTINTAFTVEAQRRQGRPPQDMISAARDTEGRNAEEIDISVDTALGSRAVFCSVSSDATTFDTAVFNMAASSAAERPKGVFTYHSSASPFAVSLQTYLAEHSDPRYSYLRSARLYSTSLNLPSLGSSSFSGQQMTACPIDGRCRVGYTAYGSA